MTGFSALSATFVSERSGWLLGQDACAADPCPYRLLVTHDGGDSWQRLPAPVPGLRPGTQGLPDRHVRFADLQDGWVFGPDLLATHDGGGHWASVAFPGVGDKSAVAALETSGGRVHAVVYNSDNYGNALIMTSPVDRDDWHASPTTVPMGAGPVPGAQIVLQGNAGWIVENDRVVVGGAELRNGDWVAWTPPCSNAGGTATLAAASPTTLAAVCDEGTWSGPPAGTHLYLSANGGASFRRLTNVLPDQSYAVAMPSPSTVVIGAAATLSESTDNGGHWRTVYRGSADKAVRELGFTTASKGVAVVGDAPAKNGELLRTTDGGRSWAVVDLSRSGA